MLAFFLYIGVVIVMYAYLSSVLSERESKIREGMRMMGLSDFGYYSSTYVFAVMWAFFIMGFVAIAIHFFPDTCTYSQPGMIFIYLVMNVLANLSLSLAISAFTSK